MNQHKLRNYYNRIYSRGKNKYFIKYRHKGELSEAHKIARGWILKNSRKAKSILDFGCGEADFLASLKFIPERIGIDFSKIAIQNASKNNPELRFILGNQGSLKQFKGKIDIVTAFGVLEHMDNPQATFRNLALCLKKNGVLIVSCPSFINVRGIIWMTLVKLLKVPMSLSDRHHLSINDFRIFAKDTNLQLIECHSLDLELAQGKDFRLDMRKRLINALKDAHLENRRVSSLIKWFEDNMQYFAKNKFSGAEMLYIFRI
jgi:2-polyprenyl-3-methyl-5-hydroxy-6-metoxy-1,4-benzoquinol methylase